MQTLILNLKIYFFRRKSLRPEVSTVKFSSAKPTEDSPCQIFQSTKPTFEVFLKNGPLPASFSFFSILITISLLQIDIKA